MVGTAPEFSPGFIGPVNIEGVLNNARIFSRHTAIDLIQEGLGVEVAVLSGVERATRELGIAGDGFEGALTRETLASVYGRTPGDLYEEMEAERDQLFSEAIHRWREELAEIYSSNQQEQEK